MAWRDLYEYWLGKHCDGVPPSRADIDPLFEIPKLLPNLYLVDVEPDGFRFRLVGSEITKRAGRDTTGRAIDRSLLSEESLASWLKIMRLTAHEQRPVLYCFSARARTAFNALGILMPLLNEAGATNMLIGGVFFGAAKQLPRPHIPDRVYEIPFPQDPSTIEIARAS